MSLDTLVVWVSPCHYSMVWADLLLICWTLMQIWLLLFIILWCWLTILSRLEFISRSTRDTAVVLRLYYIKSVLIFHFNVIHAKRDSCWSLKAEPRAYWTPLSRGVNGDDAMFVMIRYFTSWIRLSMCCRNRNLTKQWRCRALLIVWSVDPAIDARASGHVYIKICLFELRVNVGIMLRKSITL